MKKKRKAKVVQIGKAVKDAVTAPVPPVIYATPPVSHWMRFHLWIGLLPSRLRHAVANALAQSKDPHDEA